MPPAMTGIARKPHHAAPTAGLWPLPEPAHSRFHRTISKTSPAGTPEAAFARHPDDTVSVSMNYPWLNTRLTDYVARIQKSAVALHKPTQEHAIAVHDGRHPTSWLPIRPGVAF